MADFPAKLELTSIDYHKAKPLGITRGEPYLDTDFYYYTVDNVPLLKNNERDSLISQAVQASAVAGYPTRRDALLDSTFTGPVIINYQEGYIHTDFLKADMKLEEYERFGFVAHNLATGLNYYINESSRRIYYVYVAMNDVLLDYSEVVSGPDDTTAEKQALIPEQRLLYVNTSGKLCVSTVYERLKDANGSVITAGVIKGNDTSNLKFVINFNGGDASGAGSSYGAMYAHSDLTDIESSAEGDPTSWVYGHYGFATRIDAVISSAGETEILAGTIVGYDSSTTKKLVPFSQATSKPVGYVLTSSINTTTGIRTYYVVTEGEYPVASTSLIPGTLYYVTPLGVLTDSPDEDSLPNKFCRAAYRNTNTTTVVLEKDSAPYSEEIVNAVGTTLTSLATSGKQVAPRVYGSGAVVHRRYSTAQDGLTPYPAIGSGAPATIGTITYSDNRTYKVTRNTFATGDASDEQKWGYSPSQYPPDLGDTLTFSYLDAADNAEPLNSAYPHLPKPAIIIKRLSPEFLTSVEGESPSMAERFLVWTYSPISDTWRDSFSTTFEYGLPLTSAMEVEAHPLSKTASPVYPKIYVKEYDGPVPTSPTGIAFQGAAEYVGVYLDLSAGNDFTHLPPQLSTAGIPTLSTAKGNEGISLKTKDGMIGLYVNNAPAAEKGLHCAFISYQYYQRELISATEVYYKFYGCDITVSDSTKLTGDTYAYSHAMSFPIGALSFKIQKDYNAVIAGIYNANPEHLSLLNKVKGSPFSWDYYKSTQFDNTIYATLPAPLGDPTAIATTTGTLADQSLFVTTTAGSYTNFEVLSTLPSPFTGAGCMRNFFPFIDWTMFYSNPYMLGSITSSYVSQLFTFTPRLFFNNAFSRLGVLAKPFAGQGTSQYRDTFMFHGNKLMTAGPVIRTGDYPRWGNVSTAPYLVGSAFILYVFKKEDEEVPLDITLDDTALPFQMFGNYYNQGAPLAAPVARQNFDILLIVDGKLTSAVPGDTVRIWMPPANLPASDVRSLEDMDKDIGTRQRPSLVISYATNQESCFPTPYDISSMVAGAGFVVDPSTNTVQTFGADGCQTGTGGTGTGGTGGGSTTYTISGTVANVGSPPTVNSPKLQLTNAFGTVLSTVNLVPGTNSFSFANLTNAYYKVRYTYNRTNGIPATPNNLWAATLTSNVTLSLDANTGLTRP